ncbi:hypothetical protein JD969_12245 [Planctomycetota bacterium]|nr:hypothetical protein JD969_12245 [Planctomycetota bacterium]
MGNTKEDISNFIFSKKGTVLILAAIGVYICINGYKEYKLFSLSDPTPQIIQPAEIVSKHAIKNAYIKLIDYKLQIHLAIKETTRISKTSGVDTNFEMANKDTQPFNTIYIPIVPNDFEYHTSTNLILKTNSVRSYSDLVELSNTQTIRGTVINSIQIMHKDMASKFSQVRMSINTDHVIIIEHNRKPKSIWYFAVLYSIGISLLIISYILYMKLCKQNELCNHQEQSLNT